MDEKSDAQKLQEAEAQAEADGIELVRDLTPEEQAAFRDAVFGKKSEK